MRHRSMHIEHACAWRRGENTHGWQRCRRGNGTVATRAAAATGGGRRVWAKRVRASLQISYNLEFHVGGRPAALLCINHCHEMRA